LAWNIKLKAIHCIAFAVFMVAGLSGCGRNGLDKVVVSGQVAYRGEPVNNGEILFYPSGDTKGPVSGASIKDGHYEAVGKGGVPVGTHRVVVRGFRAAARSAKAAATAAKIGIEGGVREQYLPAKYNDQTTLEVTVNSDQVTHDFQLAE
jgi:hypothetical protein